MAKKLKSYQAHNGPYLQLFFNPFFEKGFREYTLLSYSTHTYLVPSQVDPVRVISFYTYLQVCDIAWVIQVYGESQ